MSMIVFVSLVILNSGTRIADYSGPPDSPDWIKYEMACYHCICAALDDVRGSFRCSMSMQWKGLMNVFNQSISFLEQI